MADGDLFVTRKDGPVSVIFPVQVTSIIRAAPFASQGLLKEPSPVEPAGQSCTGTLAVALAAGADAEGAGAEAPGAVGALLALGAPDVLFSSEQPAMDAATAAGHNALGNWFALDKAGAPLAPARSRRARAPPHPTPPPA